MPSNCRINLLAKPSVGDLLPKSQSNKARDTKVPESSADDVNHGIAFAGLVSYIEEVRMDSLIASVLH